jgi:outer membrane protein assembly factor BamB
MPDLAWLLESGGATPLGVIALPAIAPLVALIQLLFPGLLGDHWKQYRAAIGAMLSQSTFMFVHWLLVGWVVREPVWWLSPVALAWAMAGVAAAGLAASLALQRTSQQSPARIEYLALGSLAVASGLWVVYQWLAAGAPVDHALVVAVACGVSLGHLRLRGAWSESARRPAFATESVLLLALALGGAALAEFTAGSAPLRGLVDAVDGESLTFRGNIERTGSSGESNTAIDRPALLWPTPFEPRLNVGTISLDASPVVVDSLAFVGAYQQISAHQGGALYAVNARDGRLIDGKPASAGAAVWEFSDPSVRPIFSTPAVHGERLYFGEGYHHHARCRLFCVDARSGELLWAFRTASHVESPPTIVGERLYFGAGDDGLYCLTLGSREQRPQLAWHVPGVHVDASPLVADGKVFAGGVVGDIVARLAVLAVDAASGDVVWERPSELPVPSSPAYGEGAIVVGLGNGKMNQEHSQPRGGVWCLDAATGDTRWEFPLASSVLSTPVIEGDRVIAVARNGDAYAIDLASGQRIWKRELGETIVASPVVAASRIYFLSSRGVVFCLDSSSGEVVWEFDELRTSAEVVYSSPTLVDGRLYFTVAGKLYCLGEASQP